MSNRIKTGTWDYLTPYPSKWLQTSDLLLQQILSHGLLTEPAVDPLVLPLALKNHSNILSDCSLNILIVKPVHSDILSSPYFSSFISPGG